MSTPSLFDALDAGQTAAESCAANAEGQGWDRFAAGEFIIDWLRTHGPTSGEELVTRTTAVYHPHDARAFGAVFLRLKRAKLIETCGTTRRLKGHGTHGGLLWRLMGAAAPVVDGGADADSFKLLPPRGNA